MAIRFDIYTPSVRVHGAARSFVRAVDVYVIGIDDAIGTFGNIRSRCIVARHQIARSVDSRYHGPRSAYGQAMAEARALLADLTAAAAVQAPLPLAA